MNSNSAISMILMSSETLGAMAAFLGALLLAQMGRGFLNPAGAIIPATAATSLMPAFAPVAGGNDVATGYRQHTSFASEADVNRIHFAHVTATAWNKTTQPCGTKRHSQRRRPT